MIRDFLNSALQKKFYLMFFTAMIYILGLVAFFADKSVIIAFFLTVFGVFAILKNYLSPKLVLFWFFIFFFGFFNASFRIKNTDDLYKLAPQEAEISGQIISIPDKGIEGKERFFFEVSKIDLAGESKKISAKTYVSLFYDSKAPDLKIGNSYKIRGKLRTPFKVTNPSQFDYGKYLRNFNAFTVFYAKSQDCSVVKSDLSFKWKFLQGLNDTRNDIINNHSKFLKSPNLEILGGIVFGDDAVSPPDYVKKTFINSGLLHILAASGMNVALIYGIWFFLLRKLRAPFNFTVISGMAVVILYTLMTGLGPSVIRASIILLFVLFGKLIDRDADSLSLLSFVALLMLIYNPAYINDVGFQLSFIVTFGLLIMTPYLLNHTKRLPTWLSGAIFIPIIAQIWVAPIQMYYFNSFSLYSVFANILVLPFLTVISFGGFISSVLALIKPLATQICMIFDYVLNPFLNVLVYISNYFSSLPDSLIQMPKPSLLQIFLYYLAVILLTLIIKNGATKRIIATVVSLFVVVLLLGVNYSNKLEIIFFDMQNADSFLVNAKGKYFIIDTGKLGFNGSKSPAKYIVLEYLKDKGIKNIEGLILTHFDADHAGGAEDLLESLSIKNVFVNSLNDESKIAQRIYKKHPDKIKLASNNQKIFDSNNINVILYKAEFHNTNSKNENSIITLVSESDFDILFMGDSGVLAFEKVKQFLPEKIEVLKVGHHGAKNVVSPLMLERIKPDYAIISTGINNYGHPNPITLDILESYGSKILRTDRNNAIKISKGSVQEYSGKDF